MIYYQNSIGQTVQLDSGGIVILSEDLRDFAWQYTAVNRPSGVGGRVRRFSRPVDEKSISVVSRGKSRAICTEQLNLLHAITEVDILTQSPGRLYWDGQYLICYMAVSSKLIEWDRGYHYAKKEMKILVVEPYWCTEVSFRFNADSGTALEGGKKYNLRYPYRYGTGYSNKTLYNSHYAETPAIITMFGAVDDPQIIVAGHTYEVEGNLLASERIVIDQITRTVVKVDASGTRYNMFDARNKEYDIFKPIPKGSSFVQFVGEWNCEITLVQQRSEPLWT